MVVFPNCKINLGLNITGKRPDGYHNLETIFYPILLKDILEAVQAEKLTFQSSGLTIDGNAEDNLCIKAWHLLKNDLPDLPTVQIYLHKIIPMGAGLGGGSADGAFMLSLLNQKFNLQLNDEQLINYALQLGSDCPFFILNKPVFATGRGEIMTPVTVDLSEYKFLIVNPGIHISTKEAFSNLIPVVPTKSVNEIVKQPVISWKDELVNDFEKPLFKLYPEIEALKQSMYNAGSIYTSMSGSGSTVFGLFPKNNTIKLSLPDHYLKIELPAQ